MPGKQGTTGHWLGFGWALLGMRAWSQHGANMVRALFSRDYMLSRCTIDAMTLVSSRPVYDQSTNKASILTPNCNASIRSLRPSLL
jgi:hypothetical protein